MKEQIGLIYFIGQTIRGIREEGGLTQEELANELGVSRTTVVHWEEGKYPPSIEDLFNIAGVFSCPVDTFLPPYPYSERLFKTRAEAFAEFLAYDKGGGK